MNRYFGLHMLEGEWHALLPRYLLLADRVDGGRALDIGCGSGIGSSLLLELGAEMVDAIDHRPAVLELARMKHAKQGLDFHVMFWEELDFPNDTFDVVTCLDPSSPVTDPSLLQEVRRVLKPGGEYVCAIERTPIDGLEVLLPRYGYADAAENIDIHGAQTRPPQVGELKTIFPVARSVVQRPSLSYIFDADVSSGGEGDETVRKVHETGASGVWEQDASGGDGRWIAVDDSLQQRDAHVAAVELWFCGDEGAPPPPLREIRLPYFNLVERLHQVFNELQMRQVPSGDDESFFNEIVDNAAEAAETDDGDDADGSRQREITNQYRVVELDDPPTEQAIRNDLAETENDPENRPENGSENGPENAPTLEHAHERMRDPGDPLESQLQELSALYHQVRQEFQTVVRDAQTALDERDRYIAHLVGKVEEWQSRFQGDEPSDIDDFEDGLDEPDLDERTTVYEAAEASSDAIDGAEDSEPSEEAEEAEEAEESDSSEASPESEAEPDQTPESDEGDEGDESDAADEEPEDAVPRKTERENDDSEEE